MSSRLSEYAELPGGRERDAGGLARSSAEIVRERAPAGREPQAGSFHPGALEHAQLLWVRRGLLRNALLLGLAAGMALALLIPARYESTLQLMPPDSPASGGMAMLAALARTGGGMESMAGDMLGLKNTGSLFIGVLRSRTVEDRIIERFQLKKIYRVRLDEDARRALALNTGISEDRKDGIITVTVTDHDRGRARAMATAYVEELNRLLSEVSTSAAHRERVFLGDRLTGVKQELDQAARELGEFSSQNATLDVRDQGRAMVEAAASLQGALIAAESERRSLEAIYTPRNGRVRAAEAQAAELRKQLAKLGGKAAGSEPGDAAGSDSIYPSLRTFPLLGVKYEDLYRRAKVEEAVFEALTQEYEMARVEEAKETPTVKLLDDASLPERRSFPPRLLITLLCGAAASLCAVAWVVVKERWETTDETDPRKQFAQEVLDGMNSAMPWALPNGSRWQAATKRVWLRCTTRTRSPGEGLGGERSTEEMGAETVGARTIAGVIADRVKQDRVKPDSVKTARAATGAETRE
jgi:uncharacterized protein involved in exopolysaccharide biosynthesis